MCLFASFDSILLTVFNRLTIFQGNIAGHKSYPKSSTILGEVSRRLIDKKSLRTYDF